MTQDEIAACVPEPLPSPGVSPMQRARARMERTGQWSARQTMGRRWAIGCVALEVTQRCNLDCTLCYLSELSESVRDVPLAELFRRIDVIRDTYGPNTDVQVTGGDPTLRERSELVAVVRRVRERGMRPSLFTNGIRATRGLLAELAVAGLVDVAFHVDTTQGRRGYDTEAALNALRQEYVERARGLGLSVFFNTTVHPGNLVQVADVVRFMVARSDVVRLASFQLAADTGRGVQRDGLGQVTKDSVAREIQAGAGAQIAFDTPGVGHGECNRYAMTLVANGRVHDLFDDRALMAELFEATGGLQFDRTHRGRAVAALAGWLLRHPAMLRRSAGWGLRKLWAMRRDLVAGRGRVGKLSFFLHDFMDAGRLDRCRVEACAFMVATVDGPMSMCLHNARRDDFLLRPFPVRTAAGEVTWDPLRGHPASGPVRPRRVPAKGQPRAGGALPGEVPAGVAGVGAAGSGLTDSSRAGSGGVGPGGAEP